MNVDHVKCSDCSTCTQPMSADLSYTHTHPQSVLMYWTGGWGGVSLPPRHLPAAVFVAATVCITFLQENREFS